MMLSTTQLPIVRLREVKASDLPVFFENQRDPVAVDMVAYRSRDREAFDEHWAKILADDTSLKRTIVVASAVPEDSFAYEEVAGQINSWTSEGKREVGYWLGRAYWGRGIATAALTAFLLLEETRPLYASAAAQNAGSIRVLQKCGFTIVDPPDELSGDEVPHVYFMLGAAAAP
jgi:RimJ/RimL family protein N-acetyltransferase